MDSRFYPQGHGTIRAKYESGNLVFRQGRKAASAQAIHYGEDAGSYNPDVKWFGATSGVSMLWDVSANQLKLAGPTDAVTGWLRASGAMSGAVQYCSYFNPSTSGTTKLLGHGVVCTLDSGASVNTVETIQSYVQINAGSQITSRGGDATAGVHNVWAKIGSGEANSWASGARAAPIWSDIQINVQDVSSEEVFHFFASAGGSRARALIRMEDQIAVRFLESDGAIGEGFYATSGYDEPNGATAAAWLVVNVGGTNYGVPMMAAS